MAAHDWFVSQSLGLIWPADNSWYLATEVDFEATPIEPGDCLDSRGDTVNVKPVTERPTGTRGGRYDPAQRWSSLFRGGIPIGRSLPGSCSSSC
jgi:hypothetical protein